MDSEVDQDNRFQFDYVVEPGEWKLAAASAEAIDAAARMWRFPLAVVLSAIGLFCFYLAVLPASRYHATRVICLPYCACQGSKVFECLRKALLSRKHLQSYWVGVWRHFVGSSPSAHLADGCRLKIDGAEPAFHRVGTDTKVPGELSGAQLGR